MKTNKNLGILILRLTVGVLMLLHGIAKLKGVNLIEGMLGSKGLPTFLSYGVYVGEIIAPILLIIGFRTRLVALIIIFNMIVAIALVHPSEVFALSETGGWAIELTGFYLLCSLSLFFTGGGKWAVSTKNIWD